MIGNAVSEDACGSRRPQVGGSVGPVCRQFVIELLVADFPEDEWLEQELPFGLDINAGD